MKAAFRLKPYNDANRPPLKYVVNFKDSGNRSRRFFETKREAETFVQQKTIELQNHGREGAEFPSSLRIMASECSDLLKPHGKTIREATDHFLTFLRASAKSCTATALVAELLDAKRADGASRRYLDDLKSRLGRFATEWNGKVVAAISGAEIDDWLRSLKLSPTTRNNYRRLLIVMFNFAIQRGYATTNPAETTAKAKVVSEAPGILTIGEAARLLDNATADVLPFLAIGCFAGLRPAELARLEWANVDFDSSLIEVTAEKSKTARRRFVKLQPNLAQWLAPYRASKGRVCGANLRKRVEAARRAAGVAEWPANALRHGFASYHLAHFNDAAALALEMGHTDSGMIFEHYRQLVRPADAARFWQITPSADAAEKLITFSAAAGPRPFAACLVRAAQTISESALSPNPDLPAPSPDPLRFPRRRRTTGKASLSKAPKRGCGLPGSKTRQSEESRLPSSRFA